jgi:hypothetical protein
MNFKKILFTSLLFFNYYVFAETQKFQIGCLPFNKNGSPPSAYDEFKDQNCALFAPKSDGSLDFLRDSETGKVQTLPLQDFLNQVSRDLAWRRFLGKLLGRLPMVVPGLKEVPFIETLPTIAADLFNEKVNPNPLISKWAVTEANFSEFLSLFVLNGFSFLGEQKVKILEFLVEGMSIEDANKFIENPNIKIKNFNDYYEATFRFVYLAKVVLSVSFLLGYEVFYDVFKMQNFRNKGPFLLFAVSEKTLQSLLEQSTSLDIDLNKLVLNQ